MSFKENEESIESASPLELYVFTVYGTNYYFTSQGRDVTVDSILYLSYPLNRSEIENTDETPRNDMTIECDLDFPILAFYEAAPPSDVIKFQLKRIHRDDDDNELVTFWRGRVMNGKREKGRGKLYCENKYTSIKRTGLRRGYGRLCPHELYGTKCGAVENDFSFTTTLDGVSGIELDASFFATYDSGQLAGGVLYYEPTPGVIERRGIKSHVDTRIEITHPIPGLAALETVVVSPGCTHDLSAFGCQFFARELSYGGWPNVPRVNPMGNSSVF